MVVTEAAKKMLKEMLVANTKEADVFIRLKKNSESELELALGREVEGDTVAEYEDSKLLLVAPELEATLGNALLDVQETAEGAKLVVSRV
jgi:hypothetical protein